jgi:hypothetical protein
MSCFERFGLDCILISPSAASDTKDSHPKLHLRREPFFHLWTGRERGLLRFEHGHYYETTALKIFDRQWLIRIFTMYPLATTVRKIVHRSRLRQAGNDSRRKAETLTAGGNYDSRRKAEERGDYDGGGRRKEIVDS